MEGSREYVITGAHPLLIHGSLVIIRRRVAVVVECEVVAITRLAHVVTVIVAANAAPQDLVAADTRAVAAWRKPSQHDDAIRNGHALGSDWSVWQIGCTPTQHTALDTVQERQSGSERTVSPANTTRIAPLAETNLVLGPDAVLVACARA